MSKRNCYISVKMRVEITETHLKKYGPRCPLCGLKATIQRNKKGLPMWLSGKKWRGIELGYIYFHIDHIIPISRGGKNEIDNCWLLCALCNLRKYTKIIRINKDGFRATT